MEREGRYQTANISEDQYAHGSNRQVLKNLLGITTREEMERVETELLFELTDQLLDEMDQHKSFTAADICAWHCRWLETVYEWAGKYRQVMISKGGFPFAAPAQIPRLMADFEQNCLAQYTPCIFPSRGKVISALAIVHAELILIHPFREGNGRVARLLATLMALQAGLPPLYFTDLVANRQVEYFAAVQQAVGRDYGAMKKIFEEIISLTLREHGR